MPKIVDRAQMQRDILKAAVRTFSVHGFYGATMSLIAKEAGIAKGTLYLYFDSKEALSIAFVENYFSRMEQWLRQQGSAETLDAFIQQIETSLLIDETEAKFIPVFFEAFGPSFHAPKFRKTIADSFDRMGAFYGNNLHLLQEKGEISGESDPDALGRVLVSMIDGIMLHYGLFEQERENYQTMIREALALFHKGLA